MDSRGFFMYTCLFDARFLVWWETGQAAIVNVLIIVNKAGVFIKPKKPSKKRGHSVAPFLYLEVQDT